jgi:heterodisulfide reductase subunit A-like polyferredoxin
VRRRCIVDEEDAPRTTAACACSRAAARASGVLGIGVAAEDGDRGVAVALVDWEEGLDGRMGGEVVPRRAASMHSLM